MVGSLLPEARQALCLGNAAGAGSEQDRAAMRKATQQCRAVFGLNASQQRAVEAACEARALLVQGPPGTGKTSTAASIVFALSVVGASTLAASVTHAAVHNLMRRCKMMPMPGFM